jgi:hypothetical protein
MQRLWDSHPGLLVAGNFLYLPIVLDPSIVQELQSHPAINLAALDDPAASNPMVIEAQGCAFVKTVNLESLLKQYAAIDPVAWENVRRTVLSNVEEFKSADQNLLDADLKIILFQIMPYFLRRSGSFARDNFNPEGILQLISDQVQLPAYYAHRTGNLPDNEKLCVAMAGLAKQAAATPGPPPSGLMPSHALKQWFFRALTAKIAAREQARLTEVLAAQERWGDLCRKHAGLLAYLVDKASLEINGFGFFRVPGRNEYRIYKRTGEYALKDFYGRPYIFPDCRVAVSTVTRVKPFVIEHYKHPLLQRYGAGQEICVPKDFQFSSTFSAAYVIRALEAGINALYYGYNPRRRNGYHSLDRITEFRVLDFDDYRVPRDHPKIVSGEVEIKNIHFA